MTTDYGLWCQNCSKHAFYNGDFDTNRLMILQIWSARDQASRVIDLIEELEKLPFDGLEVRVSLDYGNSSPLDLFQFLKQHKGHNLIIVDEYGHLWDQDFHKIGEVSLWNS